jgi:hypothetical protein
MVLYEDERRDKRDLEQRLLADFIADPEALRRRYEGLRARDAVSRKKLIEAEKQSEELSRLQAEVADLTRRLGSAHGALEAYRSESARLKADLKRVRGSQAYRLGRALTRPASLVRRPRPDPATPQALTAAPADVTTTVDLPQSDFVGALPSPLPVVRRLSDYSFDELLERFELEQTPERLGHVLSRAWYQQGLVTLPAGLLHAHPAVADALDARGAELARRILGAERLLTAGISIPARGSGPAYRPERGRIMYCAYSTHAFNTN